MKDYFDIWMLSQSFEFECFRLAGAISVTFARCRAAIPDSTTDALSPAFAEDKRKQRKWKLFGRDVVAAPGSLAEGGRSAGSFFLCPLPKRRSRPPQSMPEVAQGRG